MKTLETMKEEMYSFRCNRCRSKFEMTKDERKENDWVNGEHKKGGTNDYPHNPTNRFYCPVCKKQQNMHDIHRYFVMDNGNVVYDY